jgi:hypothetical protein
MYSKGNKNQLHHLMNTNISMDDRSSTLWYTLTDEQKTEESVGQFSFIVIENNLKVTQTKSKRTELSFDEYVF